MPRLPRVIAGPTNLGRRATAIDLGGDQGARAQAGAAIEIGRTTNALFEADLDAKVSKGVQSASSELNDLRLEIDQNPDIDERESLYDKGQREILNRHRNSIQTVRFQNLFDERVFGISERSRLQVREGVMASRLDRIRANTIESVDGLAQLAGEADDDVVRQGYLDEIGIALRGSVTSGAFTEATVARMQIAIDKQLTEAALTRETQGIADDLEVEFDKFADQTKAARDRYNGRREDLVIARLKDRNGIKQKAKTQAEKAKLDFNVKLAMGGNLTHIEALDAGLTAKGLAAVTRVIDQVVAAKQPASGGIRYWDLRRMRESDPDKFRNLEINEEAGTITTDEVTDLKERQLQADTDALESYVQKVDRALGSLKLPVTPADMADEPDDAPRSRAFRQRIEAAKKAKRIKEKRKLTGVEIDEIIAFATKDIATDEEAFFRDQDPRARFTIQIEDIGDVPEKSEKRARAALRRQGISFPTTDQIRGTYLELLLEGDE